MNNGSVTRVRYEGRLYRLAMSQKFNQDSFKKFQEANAMVEILIYDLGGGHDVVPLKSLEYVSNSHAEPVH